MQKRVKTDMGRLGPLFRGKAKAVSEALADAVPGEDGARVVIDGEEHFVPKDMYELVEEEIEIRGEYVMPHVIEPSYGIDRVIYTVLEHSYEEEDVDGEIRRVLHFPPKIAPVQAAVLPLMTRDGLEEIARNIEEKLLDEGILAQYDDNGAIGRRYRRQDEAGTPFAVTVDYDTKEDGTVTLRDRDTMKQARVPAEEVPAILYSLIKGRINFESLCK
jgi:glycyl-tRNA synthetase